ncbi:MAG TPA: UDP-N-acetylmuramoyl-L-alanyl-D-glutamate--2,6-diaminopimelate ligase [Thermoanaerobaculia bacterium]|nr:UDP-N-acetylmuramoyl-L-alanyl-D-glutamate--2,6-diaminopimelate ligase [Thermoanaerobaculia bacterium]
MTTIDSATIERALSRSGELRSSGSMPERFTDITDDSRRVTKGALFVAMRGAAFDGHDYLGAAAASGASGAIVEDPARTTLPAFVVRDARRAAGIAARAAFADPAAEITMVGVTGTNGKTTTVGLLRHLLHDSATPAASIGTLGVLRGSAGEVIPGGSGLTTPGVIELQRVLRQLRDSGVQRVAMEVSSHSLDQRRVEGVDFEAAVFTNVSRDHLDYHQTMEAYVAAKARLLDYVTADGVAVVNADDPSWNVLPDRRRKVRFGMTAGADVSAADIRWTSRGSEWTLMAGSDRATVSLPLLGAFNVANALGAAAAAWSLGISLGEIGGKLSAAPQVPGRLERLLERPAVLRDYAHTPDALDRALDAVRPFVTGRLIVLFGCGGDRDRGKRPQMGAIAESKADHVILTSDNPRTEDPERILDDIAAGMQRSNHERIEERRAAIARALEMAGADDVVLLAGKGHETYQIRGTTSHPFDEKVIVRELAATTEQRA